MRRLVCGFAKSRSAALRLCGSQLSGSQLSGSGRYGSYPNLWGYARDLYQHPAFRETTDFGAFGRLAEGPKPSFVNDAPWRIAVEPVSADWDSTHQREALASA